jgi:hypothetical protein
VFGVCHFSHDHGNPQEKFLYPGLGWSNNQSAAPTAVLK